MRKLLGVVARMFGYAGLAVILFGGAGAAVIQLTDACPIFNESRVQCASPAYQGIAEITMSILHVTAFTGVPLLLLAMIGAVFAVLDIRRWRERRAPAAMRS